jgi:transcriptional regulator with XRE-family HTH domain
MEMVNPQVAKLFDEIQRILKRDGKTIADLARDIGFSYHQTYQWVEQRRFNPQAKGLLALQGWRDKHV